MALDKITRIVYALLGILYVLVGAGSMLLPTGWLPQSLGNNILAGEVPTPFFEHLLQEFGTVVLALGFVFLWYANRKEQSRGFHWAMTFYFSLDALIHWVGPEGLIGSWSRGIVNSIVFAVMLVLELLQLRASERIRLRAAA
jgi:hypothetical protein